jgi:hypothetical protein
MTAKRPVGNTPALFIESSHNWPCQNQLTGLGRRPFGFRQGKVMESYFVKGGLRSCLQEQATEIPETRRLHAASVEGTAPLIRRSA